MCDVAGMVAAGSLPATLLAPGADVKAAVAEGLTVLRRAYTRAGFVFVALAPLPHGTAAE